MTQQLENASRAGSGSAPPSHEVKHEVKQMWNGGPLRQFAPDTRPASNWIPLDTGGYAGSHVCAACKKVTSGVYETENGWQCGTCRANAKCQRSGDKAAACGVSA